MSKGEKFLASQKAAFLLAFSEIGIIGEACEVAGVSRAEVSLWKKDDEAFALAYRDAEDQAADSLEKEAHRRAVTGWHEPVFYKGEITYLRDPDGKLELDDEFNPIPVTVLKKSDRMLERMLEARHPKYGRKGGPGASGAIDPNDLPPTTINIHFVEPPADWDNVEWGEDGLVKRK